MSEIHRPLRPARTDIHVAAPIAVGIAVGIVLLASREALAHSQPGNLGVPASATDYYDVACYDDGHGSPTSLEIRILDASPGAAPRVAAQVQRGLTLSSVADGLTADIQPSEAIYLNEGAVSYVVLVDKTGAGAKFYELTYHCWTGPNGTGIHTGASAISRQSQ